MRKATCMSLLLLGGLTFLNANDLELEERLKAIMILFEKSETSLQEEISSLELQISELTKQNERLKQELSTERRKNATSDTLYKAYSTTSMRNTLGQPVGTDSVPLIDINKATKTELLTLPLINGFLADAIIKGRPWESTDDLVQLQGFSPMKLRRVQNLIRVGPVREITEVVASENPVD